MSTCTPPPPSLRFIFYILDLIHVAKLQLESLCCVAIWWTNFLINGLSYLNLVFMGYRYIVTRKCECTVFFFPKCHVVFSSHSLLGKSCTQFGSVILKTIFNAPDMVMVFVMLPRNWQNLFFHGLIWHFQNSLKEITLSKVFSAGPIWLHQCGM